MKNNNKTDRDKFFDELTRKGKDGITEFNCSPHNVWEWVARPTNRTTEDNKVVQAESRNETEPNDGGKIVVNIPYLADEVEPSRPSDDEIDAVCGEIAGVSQFLSDHQYDELSVLYGAKQGAFWGLRKIASKHHTPTERPSAEDILKQVLEIADYTQELNMANYDHNQVNDLNNAIIEICQLLQHHTPISRPSEEESKEDFLDWLQWKDKLPEEEDPDYYTVTWGMNVWNNAMKFYNK